LNKKKQTFSKTNKHIETLCIEIMNKTGKSLLISSLYRPPCGKQNNFINSFKIITSQMSKQDKYIFFAGDINMDALNYERLPKIKCFFDSLLEFNLIPTIFKPTRITQKTSSAIDNILTNNSYNPDFESGIFIADFSDHFPIFHIARGLLSNSDNKKCVVTKRNLCKRNLDNLKNELFKEPWNNVYSSIDPNQAFNNFTATFECIFNTVCPIITSEVKKKELKNPWMTSNLIKSSKRKQKLYIKFLKSKNDGDEQIYKAYKQFFQKNIRQAKIKYYSNQLNKNKLDIKKTWSIINEVSGKEKKKSFSIPRKIFCDNKHITNEAEIYHEFNKYFVNLGPSQASKIVIPIKKFDDFIGEKSISCISNEKISYKELNKALTELKRNKSCGYDDITSNVAIHVVECIRKPLFYLITSSFEHSTFPDKLKVAKVNPVYKNGDCNNMSNYRPISLLPVFSKIYEKVIYNRIYTYLKINKLLYKNQFGFQKGCSTEHAIIELTNEIFQCFDKGEQVLGVFIDLSKAFDTVDHGILLSKLKHYGINGLMYEWIKKNLSNRGQFVINKESGVLDIKCGVPQGSILGPLLFLIYVNDMYKASSIISSIMYADDTTLFYSHNNIKLMFETMNTELENLNLWFRANKLSLNCDKTNYILFHKTGQLLSLPLKIPDLLINNKTIKREKQAKFLGVQIDENLSWRNHIGHIESKISSAIGILYKSRSFLDFCSRKKLYFSLIHSHLSYANIVWANTHKTKLIKLQCLQNHACKAIHYLSRMDNPSNVMKNMKVLNLEKLNLYQILIFMFKYKNNMLPNSFLDIFSSTFSEKYNLRSNSSHNYYMKKTNTRYSEFSIMSQGPKSWKNLKNQSLKHLNGLSSFKWQARLHILDS